MPYNIDLAYHFLTTTWNPAMSTHLPHLHIHGGQDMMACTLLQHTTYRSNTFFSFSFLLFLDTYRGGGWTAHFGRGENLISPVDLCFKISCSLPPRRVLLGWVFFHVWDKTGMRQRDGMEMRTWDILGSMGRGFVVFNCIAIDGE